MAGRRRIGGNGLTTTSVQLSPLQREMLRRLGRKEDLSQSALVSRAVNVYLKLKGLPIEASESEPEPVEAAV